MDSRHLHQDCCIEAEIDKNKEPENDGKNEGKSGGVIADCWSKSWRTVCYAFVAKQLRQKLLLLFFNSSYFKSKKKHY